MPERNYCLVALFISLVAVARIAHGFFTSVTGPTLPSLAYNCKVDTSEVSAVFTWKGLGSVIGAIIAGFVFPRVKSGMGKLGMVGAMLIFNGCAMAAMPFVSDLILLGVISFVTTMTASFFNTGLESLVLVIWGPDESRPIIAIYHFFFTFGGFLAPFLVGLFKDADDALKKCTNRDDDDQLPTSPSNQSVHGYAFEGDFFDELDTDIIPPYLIVGGFVIGAGIFTTVCALCKLTERLMHEQADKIDERVEEPVRKLWLFFIFDMIIHACAANMDTIFQSFIYTYSLCSETFDYTPQAANDVNTVFWIAFMAGRLSGTFISIHVAPWTFIIVDCLGSIVGLSLIIGVDKSGDPNKALLYTGVVFFGYFVSCVYGCATNLCNGYTNMGLSYVFINNLGASVGTMVGPRVTGFYMDKPKHGPISFVWACLVCTIIAQITELFIHLEGSRVRGRSYAFTARQMLSCGKKQSPTTSSSDSDEQAQNEDKKEQE